MINRSFIKAKADTVGKFSVAFAKWVLIAVFIGAIGGLVGTFFHMAVLKATEVRESFPFLIYFPN